MSLLCVPGANAVDGEGALSVCLVVQVDSCAVGGYSEENTNRPYL